MANEHRPAGAASGLIAASKTSKPRAADIGHDVQCEAHLAGQGYTGQSLVCNCPVRETTWVLREATAVIQGLHHLIADDRPEWEARSAAMKVRKLALLAYIEPAR